MTTIYVSYFTKDGNKLFLPTEMDCFFDESDLKMIRRGIIRKLIGFTGNDVNGGFYATIRSIPDGDWIPTNLIETVNFNQETIMKYFLNSEN